MIVCFDIGATLGTVRVSPPPPVPLQIDVYPDIRNILVSLKAAFGVRLGIISNTGAARREVMNPLLEASGILEFFEPELLFYSAEVGLEKDSPEIFRLVAAKAGLADALEKCLFVGEDSQERIFAKQAGWKVSPHPRLAAAVLKGDALRFVRIQALAAERARWREALRSLSVVPLHASGQNGDTILAIAPQQVISTLSNMLFTVDLLGAKDDPLTKDLFILQDDLAGETGFLTDQGQSAAFFGSEKQSDWLLSSSGSQLLVALPGDETIEDYHFEHTRHGHNHKLKPDSTLLEPFGRESGDKAEAWLVEPTALHEESLAILSAEEKQAILKINAAAIAKHLDLYTGTIAPAEGELPLRSRHIHHADNRRTVDFLARDLATIGRGALSVNLHPFTHEGRTLYNVSADLAGDPGREWIFISAHLDSTATSSSPFAPRTDPAPGADDDASGVAAVLAIAEIFTALAASRKPKRSFRFVLFNAEEHGLVGSEAYAADAAALSTPIVAVFQMDMIGYNVLPPRSFEMHVGFWPHPDVQARSVVLAERVQRWKNEVAPLLENPQIYISTGPTLASGRDPAEGRSDHGPFHARGYAAAVISEDFFAGPRPESNPPEANPHYHKKTDTIVDHQYAADIARAIAAGAWITGKL
jgi:leucyl aminopeptidase